MGRAFFELGFVAVTAVALYFLWSHPDLPGWLRFGALLVGTMVADKLFKFEAYMALLSPSRRDRLLATLEEEGILTLLKAHALGSSTRSQCPTCVSRSPLG